MHKSGASSSAKLIVMSPIGVLRTPFKHAAGTPVQGVSGRSAEGVVELHAEYVAGLRDLAGFERIWLIYFLDRASDVQMKVQPFMDTTARVFLPHARLFAPITSVSL